MDGRRASAGSVMRAMDPLTVFDNLSYVRLSEDRSGLWAFCRPVRVQ